MIGREGLIGWEELIRWVGLIQSFNKYEKEKTSGQTPARNEISNFQISKYQITLIKRTKYQIYSFLKILQISNYYFFLKILNTEYK